MASSLLCDVQPTVNKPHYPGAIQWSEENLLAVATANTVVIMNPAHLSGPRSFVEFTKQEVRLHSQRQTERSSFDSPFAWLPPHLST